jgi:predicted transcriptional regulator YdeE
MEHRIEVKESFKIIGRTKRMSEREEFWHDIGKMWTEWNDGGMTKKMAKYSADNADYDMDVSIASADDPQVFTYTVGVRYNGAENIEGYDVVTVPGGRYAVFEIPQEYRDDVGEFMGKVIEYLPTAGYERLGIDVEYFMGEKWEAWELIK